MGLLLTRQGESDDGRTTCRTLGRQTSPPIANLQDTASLPYAGLVREQHTLLTLCLLQSYPIRQGAGDVATTRSRLCLWHHLTVKDGTGVGHGCVEPGRKEIIGHVIVGRDVEACLVLSVRVPPVAKPGGCLTDGRGGEEGRRQPLSAESRFAMTRWKRPTVSGSSSSPSMYASARPRSKRWAMRTYAPASRTTMTAPVDPAARAAATGSSARHHRSSPNRRTPSSASRTSRTPTAKDADM